MTGETTSMARARLVLEDGTMYTGRSFGAGSREPVTQIGEVVFNTAMSGYQEALTDPSYAGQILVMTNPQVGNYGVCAADVESGKPQVAGFVVRELSRVASNYRAEGGVGEWLAAGGIPGIQGLDTRSLVRHLREKGAMRGVLSTDESLSDAALLKEVHAASPMTGRNLAKNASPKSIGVFTGDLDGWWDGSMVARPTSTGKHALRVLALDCGAKRTIYRHLVERGCSVHVLPHDTGPEVIREMKPDGLFISNGPGDPAAVEETILTLRELAGEFPTFGICLGHQLLALALGGTTYKLKFGHRGANQPVLCLASGRVEITSQNHGFCVDEKSLEQHGCEVTHRHLNDQTVAGFRHCTRPILGVQYHPEASPGPHDSGYLFDCFIHMMKDRRPADLRTRLPVSQEA